MSEEGIFHGGDLEPLRDQGWVLIPSNFHDESALVTRTQMLAKLLGTPIRGRARQMVEVLRPKAPEAAPSASLSRKYGFHTFPFHVDTTHWVLPARFLVLSCVIPGDVVVPTLLVNRDAVPLSKEEKAMGKSAVFLIRNGRHSFYSSIFGNGRDFIRYDPGCMEPQTENAIEAIKLYSHDRVSPHVHEIVWSRGDSLIIDNWQILHARASVSSSSSERLLLRCLVS